LVESSLGRKFMLSYCRSFENFRHLYLIYQQSNQGNSASWSYMLCILLTSRVLRLVGSVLVKLCDFYFLHVHIDITRSGVAVNRHQHAVCKRSGVSYLLTIPYNTLFIALGRSPASRMPTYGWCLHWRFRGRSGVRSGESASVGRPRKVPRWCPGYIIRLIEVLNEVATLTGG